MAGYLRSLDFVPECLEETLPYNARAKLRDLFITSRREGGWLGNITDLAFRAEGHRAKLSRRGLDSVNAGRMEHFRASEFCFMYMTDWMIWPQAGMFDLVRHRPIDNESHDAISAAAAFPRFW